MGLKDLSGLRFGRVVVSSRARNRKDGTARWNYLCDCGTHGTTTGWCLRSGHTQSCGCIQKENASYRFRKHGMARTRTWQAWSNMKKRCHENSWISAYYANRGIKVCERWNTSFENFLEDMGEMPDRASLDRIDNDGPYSAENCRWATHTQQMNNTRKTIKITFNGKTKSLAEWARELGVDRNTLRYRLRVWAIDRALGA